jgi:hypothetical protein
MKTLFQEDTRSEILRRIDRLTPRSARLWGRMDVGQMVAHCGDQLRLALGDLGSSPPSGPMRFPPLRWIIIHQIPWPKGKAAAPPELFTTPPASLDGDRQALRTLIERFGRAAPESSWPSHPKFGNLSGKDWGVLGYRHLDHHLRQFGQ